MTEASRLQKVDESPVTSPKSEWRKSSEESIVRQCSDESISSRKGSRCLQRNGSDTSFSSRKGSEGSSEGEGTGRRRPRAGSDLPDLTKQLVKAGIYEEYKKYSENYRKWRQGDHHGARGEVSDVVKHADEKDPHKIELWFPTPQKFHFFFTMSYWGAILSLEGSLLFIVTSALPFFGQSSVIKSLISWGTFVGSTIFGLAVYCFYLELINLEDAERVYLFPSCEHWATVLQRVRWDSFMGTMTYAVAAVIYQVLVTLHVLHVLPKALAPLACLGGLGFFLGGMCEVSHNCWGAHGPELGPVVAWLNCIGGLTFFLAGTAEVGAPDMHSFINWNYTIGSALYSISSGLLLVMWQSNDFGGSLLNQLNHSICAGGAVNITPGPEGQDILRVSVDRSNTGSFAGVVRGVSRRMSNPFGMAEHPDKKKKKLSLRDVLSLCILCWLFVCTTANFIVGVLLSHDVSDLAMTLIWILAVKVILVVHSAITHVPNEQPYRFAMQSMRFLLVCAAVVQTIRLVHAIPAVAAAGHGSSHTVLGPSPSGQLPSPPSGQWPSHGGEL